MAPGDTFVGSDVHNTPICVVKSPHPPPAEGVRAPPAPPLSLAQAGHVAICRSDAWNSKMVTSAWWVYPDQASYTQVIHKVYTSYTQEAVAGW
eukprot:1194742-Prorocentrum_minimum.AAC.4